MHGVQPIAKIAPSPNDASQPPRALTTRAPSRSPMPGRCRHRRAEPSATDPVAVASAHRRAGVERSPGALEDRDAQDAGQAQAEDDEEQAADDPERGQVVVQRDRRRTSPSRRGA